MEEQLNHLMHLCFTTYYLWGALITAFLFPVVLSTIDILLHMRFYSISTYDMHIGVIIGTFFGTFLWPLTIPLSILFIGVILLGTFIFASNKFLVKLFKGLTMREDVEEALVKEDKL